MNETYSRIMVRVFGRFKSDTIRILQLLLYSARPLRVDELIDAIAVQPEKSPSFEAGNRIRRPAEIARCCSSLIKLVKPPDGSHHEGALELHLAHFTVHEYLLASPEYAHYFQEVPSRSLIASICISYLQCINSRIGNGESEGEVETAFPFVGYNCESWISHAASTERYDSAVFDKTMEFLLKSDSDCYKYWNHTTGVFEDGYSPIWHACQAGLSIRFLEHLFGHEPFVGMDINDIEQDDDSLLSMTCTRGDVQITQFLLSRGAIVKAAHFLNAAGNEEVVRALLQKAGTSLQDDPQYTSWVLGDACVSGNLGVVRLIIEYESSFVDLVDRDNGPPLWAACANGHEDVALLLLEKEADALYDWDYQDLINLIFEKGLKRTLEEVLKKFPTIAQREHIIQAARIGNAEFIQIIWIRGRLKRESLSVALWNAAKADKEDAVRLLLQLGADGRFQYNDEDDEEFQTPLEVAQALEHTGVVSLLLEAEGTYISSDDQEHEEEDVEEEDGKEEDGEEEDSEEEDSEEEDGEEEDGEEEDGEEEDGEEEGDKEEDEDCQDCQDCQECQEGSISKSSSRFNRWWRRRLHRKKEVRVATLTRRGDPPELVPAKLPKKRKISIRIKMKGEMS
jgi:ankyrin repeat protein